MGQVEYILDPVIGVYDYEKPFSEKKDFAMKQGMNGIPIQFLNGAQGENTTVELIDVIVGNDLNNLEGLGNVKSQDGALFRYLVRTRNLLQNSPELVKGYQNPQQVLKMFDYAIRYWNTDKRTLALDRLAQTEQSLISKGEILMGIDFNDPVYDWEEDTEFSGFEGEDPDYEYVYIDSPGSIGELGRKPNKRMKKNKKKGGFFNKLNDVNKKIIDAHKKVGKKVWDINKKIVKKSVDAVLKYNPVSLTARQGLLVAFRTNLFKMSDKLKYAFLTEAQAQEHGLDVDEWKKLVKTWEKVQKLYTKTLKGNIDHLKQAIFSGKRKDFLKGVEELGEAATAAASTAAASSFIATIGAWLKKINFGKLTKGAKSIKDAGVFNRDPEKKEAKKEKREEKKAFKEKYKQEHGGKSRGWREAWKQEHGEDEEYSPENSDTQDDTPPEEKQGKRQGTAEDSFIETENNSGEGAGNEDKPGLWERIKGWSVPAKIGAGVGVVAAISGIALASSKKLRIRVGLQKPDEESEKAPKQKKANPAIAGTGKKGTKQPPNRPKLT